MADPLIIQRLDMAFERARWRFPESVAKCLYLDAVDWREFDAAMSEAWGARIHCFTYRGVDIRSGQSSRLILKCASVVVVPKHVSPRTRERKAAA